VSARFIGITPSRQVRRSGGSVASDIRGGKRGGARPK